MTRAKTAEEVRDEVIEHVRAMVRFWATRTDISDMDRCDGVAFSILSMIDGCSAGLPAIDLVMRPHPDDKAFHQAEGDDWIEDGTVINADVHMHDIYVRTSP